MDAHHRRECCEYPPGTRLGIWNRGPSHDKIVPQVAAPFASPIRTPRKICHGLWHWLWSFSCGLPRHGCLTRRTCGALALLNNAPWMKVMRLMLHNLIAGRNRHRASIHQGSNVQCVAEQCRGIVPCLPGGSWPGWRQWCCCATAAHRPPTKIIRRVGICIACIIQILIMYYTTDPTTKCASSCFRNRKVCMLQAHGQHFTRASGRIGAHISIPHCTRITFGFIRNCRFSGTAGNTGVQCTFFQLFSGV